MSETKQKEANLQVKFEDIQFKEEGKVKAIVALIFAVVGLIFLFTEKDDQYVRYYSAMSVVLSAMAFAIVLVIVFLAFIIPPLVCFYLILFPALFVIIIIGIVKISNGEKWELPLVTEYSVKLMNAL